MSELWHYRARNPTVIDGDTIDFEVDLGFQTFVRQRFRLEGIDTAEVYAVAQDSEEYEKGKKHQQFTIEWIGQALQNYDGKWPFILHTSKRAGKYGRFGAVVTRRTDDARLDEALYEKFGDEVRYERD